MNALFEGKLHDRITNEYEGYFQELKENVNNYCDSLEDMITQIHVAADSVMSGANSIQEGNAQLNSRTESQACNLESTARNMEEITSTVKQNTEHVMEANELAMWAREEAEKGGVVARDAIQSMSDINDASQKIGAIISVIDDIAFQTNLLALNATVEAARAGEHGRGFAAVATEVRTLAGRSATAAKEIKDLIEDSRKKVDEGNRLVQQSGESLEKVVGSIQKVTEIFSEITIASREQRKGIEEVNSMVTQMDTVTQNNAVLVEEAALAANLLREQAEWLNGLVSFFKLESGVPINSVTIDNSTHEKFKASA